MSLDDDSAQKDGKGVKAGPEPDAGPKVTESRFTASGLPALDICEIQKAALEGANKPVLTPQQQLEVLKRDREKRGKPKGKAANL